MSRPASDSPSSVPALRKLAGRFAYAAAAHASGNVWGSSRLEAHLGFRPTSRNQTLARKQRKPKATGCCKRWISRGPPQDQTITLIGRQHPAVATAIKHWRDSKLLSALASDAPDYRLVGTHIAPVSTPALWAYLGYSALGHCNPQFEGELATAMAEAALQSPSLPLLIGCVAIERQVVRQKRGVLDPRFERIFEFLLTRVKKQHPEIEFAEKQIREVREIWKAETSAQQQATAATKQRAEVAAKLQEESATVTAPVSIELERLKRYFEDRG